MRSHKGIDRRRLLDRAEQPVNPGARAAALILGPRQFAAGHLCALAQIAHAIIAVLFIALILGHIYIGTLGTEGAFEAMGTGEVDVNWAKEHHDLWLQKKLAEGRVDPAAGGGAPSGAPAK